MKRRVRKEMKATLAGMSAEAAARKSRDACSLLLGCEEFLRARTVMLYLSMPRELDVAPALHAAWAQGKRVLVPRVDLRVPEMIAVEIRSLETDVAPGTLGILEPLARDPVAPGDIDLVIVPGLAFDNRGRRLGRGAGFYDRFLSDPHLRATACGIAFAEQVIAAVPVDDHDVPLHMLVTDLTVTRFPVPCPHP